METLNKTFTQIFKPKTIDEVVLMKRIKDKFKDDIISQHALLHGSSGLGKSALVAILAEKYNAKYVNVSLNGKIDNLRDDINDFCSDASIDGRPKLLWFDELDGASIAFFEGLRGFMDTYDQNVRFIGTCNNYGRVATAAEGAIISRMRPIDFNPVNPKEEAELKHLGKARIITILKGIKMEYTDEGLDAFVSATLPDFREVLQLLQDLYKADVKLLTPETVKLNIRSYEVLYNMILDAGVNSVELHKLVVADYADQADSILNSLHSDFPEYILKKAPDRSYMYSNINSIVAYHIYNLPVSIDKVLNLKACILELHALANQEKKK